MSHDHNGRVGIPRCEECNAPLFAEERLGMGQRRLCFDCRDVETVQTNVIPGLSGDDE